MQSLYQLTEFEILNFILVLLRISAFFVVFPLFSSVSVPAPAKILLSLVMAVVLLPTVQGTWVQADILTEYLVWLGIKEILVGFLIGFVAKFFIFTMSICGELISISLGLSSSQLFNPAFGRSTLVVERYQLYLGSLFFLAINGHHIFIEGLAQSFELLPLSQDSFNSVAFRDLALGANSLLIMGIKISAPVMGAVFFMNVAMGIIGRAVPQVNVLITSWPLNILVGLGVMIASVPLMVAVMGNLLNGVAEDVFQLMKTL